MGIIHGYPWHICFFWGSGWPGNFARHRGSEESSWRLYVSHPGPAGSPRTQDLEPFEEGQTADDSALSQPAAPGPGAQNHSPHPEEVELPALVGSTL